MIKSEKARDYEGINIIDVNNEPSPHDPTNVLEIEVVRVWNERYIWRISYQDEDILHNKLEDSELGFSCIGGHPLYEGTTDYLDIRGGKHKEDLNMWYIDYEDLIKLVTKVDAINKKYRDEKLLKQLCVEEVQEENHRMIEEMNKIWK